DIGYHVENVIVEYCEIYGNDNVQLYFANVKNCIARYNLIYGTVNGTGSGIVTGFERARDDYYYNGYVKIYGNLIANTDDNIWLRTQIANVNKHNEVYNNTLVEARRCAVRVAPNTGGGHIFKNNIIWQTDADITNSVPAGAISNADYNLWSKIPHKRLIGTHDPSYAVPKLIKTSGWNRLKSNGLLGKDFALQKFSPAIGQGFPLNNIFNKMLDCDESQWPSKVVVVEKNKSNWDIGADNVSSSLSSSFLPPPSLQIVFNKN
ncbi:MAG: hypothetical protein J7L08_01075, partial [Candidatus Aenigmarchaeota archaeon]|nr:hypothetical protein [Candidatus Aenigmarchaeota archaeon]